MVRRAVLLAACVVACAEDAQIGAAVDAAAVDGPVSFAPAPPGDFYRADVRPPDVPAVANLSGDASCAMQSMQAERVPLDLFVMMDSSYSMLERIAAGQTKWDAVRAAMGSFLMDPQSAGLGVGLQYFPLIRPGVPEECAMDGQCGMFGPCNRRRTCWPAQQVTPCNTNADCGANRQCVLVGVCPTSGFACPLLPGIVCQTQQRNRTEPCVDIGGYCGGRDMCEATAYAQAAVPVATLPAGAAALTASLAQRKPDGLTPTGPALAGGIEQARARARTSPGRKVAVVLATDGLPVSCAPADIAGIAALADAAAKGTPRVPTFVVGVFAPAEASIAQPNLDQLARAGGSGRAFVINTDQNVTQAFTAALNEIRTAALACEFKIPPPSMGAIDFGRVNVQFTPGTGGATTIGNVRDKASCHPMLGGWYYDVDPARGTPTTIAMCDATCSRLRADARGRVDIVLGCKTQLIE